LIRTNFGRQQWRPSSNPGQDVFVIVPARFARRRRRTSTRSWITSASSSIGLLKAAEVHHPAAADHPN
jgi:hypothetical protein